MNGGIRRVGFSPGLHGLPAPVPALLLRCHAIKVLLEHLFSGINTPNESRHCSLTYLAFLFLQKHVYFPLLLDAFPQTTTVPIAPSSYNAPPFCHVLP